MHPLSDQTNPSEIAQIVSVDCEGEAEVGTEGMVPCTMILSNVPCERCS